MIKKVFFSFHYEKDYLKAEKIKNFWVNKPDREAAGFWDILTWDEVKKKGERAIGHWINQHIEGTLVTIVLIGAETANQSYVLYEIKKSYERGNGVFGIYIHGLRDHYGHMGHKGIDPYSKLGYKGIVLYDWVYDKGQDHLDEWIAAAYERTQQKTAEEKK